MQAGLGPQGKLLGFLDADPARRGHKIHGLPVLGNSHDLPMLHTLYGVHEIYIAGSENNGMDMSNLLRVCSALGLGHRVVTMTIASTAVTAAPASSGLAVSEGMAMNLLH
jgi:FlaA1/EpsC-like NDP-sugar epimerase